ncbi:MAG: GNAT family N-acetyltransferase [Parashewanella sp.]
METESVNECRAVYLTAEDIRIASSLLYNAYLNDPFFNQVLNQGEQSSYEQKLRAAIREELSSLWEQNQVLIGLFDGDRLLGVACILTQDVPLGIARKWNWRLKMMLATGWKPTQSLIDKESNIVNKLPNRHCGILQFIAVAPNEQNKGYGSKLIRAVQSWELDQPLVQGIGVFVTNDDDIKLFFNAGFEAIADINTAGVVGNLMYCGK